MNRTIRVVALFGSGTVLLSFAVLVVNQTAQVVQLSAAVHPALGTVTLWGLVGVYVGLIGTPVVMVLRLPPALRAPLTDDGPEFAAHVQTLRTRLSANPLLAGHDLSDRRGVEEALAVLASRAEAVVRETASGVFLATAVSQSGRLDGLMVLGAQTRMVWRIARIHQQRPGVRDLAHLYANVAATAFLAGEVEDVDLSEQVEPVLTSALGALGAGLPGLQVAGSVLTHCVLSGSANAFLTLRVGMIARRHCGALVFEPRRQLRRLATAEAARCLGSVVTEGSARISRAVWRASVEKVGGAVAGFSGRARTAGASFLARVRNGSPHEQTDAV